MNPIKTLSAAPFQICRGMIPADSVVHVFTLRLLIDSDRISVCNSTICSEDDPNHCQIGPCSGFVASISRRQPSACSISKRVAVHTNLLCRKITPRRRLMHEWIVSSCAEEWSRSRSRSRVQSSVRSVLRRGTNRDAQKLIAHRKSGSRFWQGRSKQTDCESGHHCRGSNETVRPNLRRRNVYLVHTDPSAAVSGGSICG